MFPEVNASHQYKYNLMTKLVFPSICVCFQKKIIMLLTTNTCTADSLLTEMMEAR